MQTTTHSNIAALARLCALKGITDVVVSPGSRNAPISIAMNREDGLTCHVVVDERCAAFVALGMAQKSGRCVATVCTSGTALLDQSPAIAEAYYQEIPLLVISADRPAAWIDQADSQTMRQNNILGNFVKASYTLPATTDEQSRWYANRMVNEAINTATSGRKGPVHLNVPCDNPLYDVAEQAIEVQAIGKKQVMQVDIEETVSGKIMIVAGFMRPDDRLLAAARELSGKGVAVVAENLSNLYGAGITNAIDPLFKSITEEEEQDFCPDLLIAVGGALVSKNAKLYFRKHAPKAVWRVGTEDHLIDTFEHIDQQITCEPATFMEALAKKVKADGHYAQLIRDRHQQLEQEQAKEYGQWNETGIFKTIIDQLPEGSDLHLSNGTSVRNGQKWNNDKGLHLYSNRGVSGIDGCTSTAVGSALMNNGQPTTLITGDLCFLYDSNALWNDEWPKNLRIFIINNNGGGIFRKMEGPKQVAEFERYFVTPQKVEIEHLCKAYQIDYAQANNMQELKEAITANKTIVEICI